MISCWFGARWFGILGIHPSNNPFHKGIPRIPNHQVATGLRYWRGLELALDGRHQWCSMLDFIHIYVQSEVIKNENNIAWVKSYRCFWHAYCNKSYKNNKKETLWGCFLKWWYPHFTPQVMIIFSRKTPWLLGKPIILGFTPMKKKITATTRSLQTTPWRRTVDVGIEKLFVRYLLMKEILHQLINIDSIHIYIYIIHVHRKYYHIRVFIKFLDISGAWILPCNSIGWASMFSFND